MVFYLRFNESDVTFTLVIGPWLDLILHNNILKLTLRLVEYNYAIGHAGHLDQVLFLPQVDEQLFLVHHKVFVINRLNILILFQSF